MPSTQSLELVTDQSNVSELVYQDQREYEKFRENFYEDVKPALEKWLAARQKSEEEAKRRFV